MAKNEITFQQEWMKDARNLQCHAVRVADMYKIGTVDVYVKHPSFPSVWIENKYIKSVGRNMGISPMQRQFLKKELRAGGYAGWMCCVEIEQSNRWEVWAGANPDATHVKDGEYVETRFRGEKWPVWEVLAVITRLVDKWRKYGVWNGAASV